MARTVYVLQVIVQVLKGISHVACTELVQQILSSYSQEKDIIVATFDFVSHFCCRISRDH